METKTAKTEFLALSRICLNNWHYIAKRTLSFHQDINFFYRTFRKRKVYGDRCASDCPLCQYGRPGGSLIRQRQMIPTAALWNI